MPTRRCPFCTHDNPAPSRFCNECGSPLHLKPCPQCAAVSDETARRCHQCGAEFAPVEIETVEPLTVESAPAPQATTSTAADSRATSDDATVGVLSEAPAAATADKDVHVYVPESFAASLSSHAERIGDVLLTSKPDRTPRLPPFAIEAFAAARRDRAQYRRRNAALALLLAASLGALAYFAYRPAPTLDAWLAVVQRDALGVVRAAVAADRTRPPQEATRASVGATDAMLPTGPTETTVTVPAAAAPASDPATPAESRSIDARADTATPPAAHAESGIAREMESAAPAEERTPTATAATAAPTAEPRRAKIAPAAQHSATASLRSSRRSAEASARATDSVPAYAQSPAAAPPSPPPLAGPCTREVAALGLC